MDEEQQIANFPTLLVKHKEKIGNALPAHIDIKRMMSIAMSAYRQNPELGKCEPDTILAAVIQSAQLGLEPNSRGQSFLVPYFNKRKGVHECQLVPGWRGLTDLLARAGKASVDSGVVYEGDEFDLTLGSDPKLTVRPKFQADHYGAITHFWAIGTIFGSPRPIIEVWSKDRLMRHRDKYNKVGERHYSFREWEMYGRKVVTLQVLKYLPQSTELRMAVELADSGEVGAQHLSTEKVIDGSWQPVYEADDEAPVDMPARASERAEKPAQAGATIGPGQTKTIQAKLGAFDVPLGKFLSAFDVEELGHLPVKQYRDALAWIEGAS